MCQVIPTSNLTESHWFRPYNESLSSTGPYFNRAFFGRGYNGQWTLFTASTDNMHGRTRFTAPFLTSKVLEKEGDNYAFRYSFQNETAMSALRLKDNKMVKGPNFSSIFDSFFLWCLNPFRPCDHNCNI